LICVAQASLLGPAWQVAVSAAAHAALHAGTPLQQALQIVLLVYAVHAYRA
jgi:hypothetical protein